MSARTYIAGVGMVPFAKPSASVSWDEMGVIAARGALADGAVEYNDVGQAYVGYVYGDSTAGQSVVYQLGLSGIPVVNVNNNCATGSTALFLARQAVMSGVTDVALAVGFEQMNPGALGTVFADRKPVMTKFMEALQKIQKVDPAAPPAAQMFGGAGREHQERYGTRNEIFAKVSEKARRHAEHNPYAVFRSPLTVEEILQSPPIYGPLTRLQCCPPTCGAAAAVVVSEGYARRRGLAGLVEIAGQALVTDTPSTFESDSMMKLVGYDMTRAAAARVYEEGQAGPEEIQAVELHDCFTANEIITYEALGLCEEGGAERFVLDGDNTYGGRFVVNPSGGLLSKGHPLGATGLAQAAELVWQLRGAAERRQVPNLRNALQHNIGLGGACVVTMFRRAG